MSLHFGLHILADMRLLDDNNWQQSDWWLSARYVLPSDGESYSHRSVSQPQLQRILCCLGQISPHRLDRCHNIPCGRNPWVTCPELGFHCRLEESLVCFVVGGLLMIVFVLCNWQYVLERQLASLVPPSVRILASEPLTLEVFRSYTQSSMHRS